MSPTPTCQPSRIFHLGFAAFLFAALAIPMAHGSTIIVDGTYDSFYGAALATQTNNTQFGNSTVGNGTSTGGSELDAAYATIADGNLYLLFTGNFENNGNVFDLFIADGRAGGQNILSSSTSAGTLKNMNGSVFSPGFNATLAFEANNFSNTFFVDQYNLLNNTGNFVGSVPLTNGTGTQTLSGVTYGMNNRNAAGVTAGTSAANTAAANAVTTGFEMAIPLAALGNPTGNILLLADINGGSDGFLSNQFLPGLPTVVGNVGGGGAYTGSSASKFNFSSVANFWISVAVPFVSDGTWLPTGSGSWNTAANWSNSNIPNAAGASASFASATANSIITLDGTQTTSNVSFDSPSFSYTVVSGTDPNSTLVLSGTDGTATITDYAGSHSINTAVALHSNAAVTVASHGDVLTLTGNISGTGSFSVTTQGGSSSVLISGSNSWSGGTTVAAGNLQLGSPDSLPAGTALTLSALDLPSGVLDLNSFSASVSSITVLTGTRTGITGSVAQIINTSASSGTATFTYAGSNGNPSTFNGRIKDNAGGGGSTTALNVSTGSLTLTGSNSYAGPTTIQSGALLAIGTGGSIGSSPVITIAASGTLNVTNLPSAFTVGSNQAVTANGTVTGPMNIQGSISGTGTTGAIAAVGGTVTPGNGILGGKLTTGDLSLDAASQLRLTISGTDVYTGLDANGAISLGGSLLITLGDGFTANPGDKFYVILNELGSSISGAFSNIGAGNILTINGAKFFLNYADSFNSTSNDLSLTFLEVPEPDGATFLSAGAACLLAWRLRPRRRSRARSTHS